MTGSPSSPPDEPFGDQDLARLLDGHDFKNVKAEDLWSAYEAVQSHYDADLGLFTNRMNLFLVVESGLLAFLGGATVRQDETTVLSSLPGWIVPTFGVTLSAAWLLVAVSAYRWIRVWRMHAVFLGRLWATKTGVVPSAVLLNPGWRATVSDPVLRARLPNRIDEKCRPTTITFLLPVIFLLAWILLGAMR